MDEFTHSDIRHSFRTPAIRHLAWLCQAPQLLGSPITFEPGRCLPTDYTATLQAWDRDPDSAPALLREPPQRRLGFYVERLYQVLLADLLGWDILLQNRQIQSNGRTIGELDFVVHNHIRDRIEHHEIAIKYYLGVSRPDGRPLWYGPNARDRLDLKTDRMLHQQSHRAQLPEARTLLAEAGITGPLTPRIFMPGYLFYPDHQTLAAPEHVPAGHLRGRWRYLSQVSLPDMAGWVVLNKPNWIGPWCQREPPQTGEVIAALDTVERFAAPRLFALLRKDSTRDLWHESDRLFVVPDNWP